LLEKLSGVFTVLGGAVLVLVGPMPRYVTGKCSGDPGHGDKFDIHDFEEDIMEAQETHRHILTSWPVSKNIQAEYLDATALSSLTLSLDAAKLKVEICFGHLVTRSTSPRAPTETLRRPGLGFKHQFLGEQLQTEKVGVGDN
jgi:hypothetical protein